MAKGSDTADDRWDEVLASLSALITNKSRADGAGWSQSFDWMQTYLQRLEMDDKLRGMKIIHVAGTKGKGSTCAMVESILRKCGYSTGLYTSPHLCDVRERIRINGQMVSKAQFAETFWWCRTRLQETATEEIGMPGYFRFITLLGLKVFLDTGVDAVVLEVGLGGRLDATNIIPPPVVCGIASIGFDHMHLLGNTLPEIAREKGGILKAGAPAFTVPQREEALLALQECAATAGTTLEASPSLDSYTPPGSTPLQLGLQGEHQHMNAALAVQLAATWERGVAAEGGAGSAAARARVQRLDAGQLPAEYSAGLATATWSGRCQVVEDWEAEAPSTSSPTSTSTSTPLSTPSSVLPPSPASPPENAGSGPANGAPTAGGCGTSAGQAAAAQVHVKGRNGGGGLGRPQAGEGGRGSRLSFCLDGAHTVESLASCADWFAGHAAACQASLLPGEEQRQLLLFNCTQDRDPTALLPVLMGQLGDRGLHVHQALFVPPESSYSFLRSKQQLLQLQQQPLVVPEVDLSWQAGMQRVWEQEQQRLKRGGAGGGRRGLLLPPLPGVVRGQGQGEAAVVPSLRLAVSWLRQCVREQPQLRLKVLVTGSLYIVGDVLGILGCPPK